MKYNLLNENTIFDNKNKIAETILLKNEAISLPCRIEPTFRKQSGKMKIFQNES